jgi:Cysteine-rich secretory protein family
MAKQQHQQHPTRTTARTTLSGTPGFGMIRRLSATTRKGLSRLRTSMNSNAGGDNPSKRKLLRKQSKRDLSLQHKFHTAGGVYMDLAPPLSQLDNIIDEESSWTQGDDLDFDSDVDNNIDAREGEIIDSMQPVLDDQQQDETVAVRRNTGTAKSSTAGSSSSSSRRDDDLGIDGDEKQEETDDEEEEEEEEEIHLIQRAAAMCTGSKGANVDSTTHGTMKGGTSYEKATSSTKTEGTCATTVSNMEEDLQDDHAEEGDTQNVSSDEEEADAFSTSFVPSRSSSVSSIFSNHTNKSQRNLFAMDQRTTLGGNNDASAPQFSRGRKTLWNSSGGLDHHRGSPVVAPRSQKRQELIDPDRPELILGENEVLSKILAQSRRLPKHPGSYASLHVLINNERVKRQVAPLTRMAELDTMAREHAKMMAEDPNHRHQQHPSQHFLERVVLKTLLDEHDYTVHRIASNAWSCGASELKDVHKELMEHSKSDRNNILDRRYTRMGVGTYQSPANGKLYVCQLFID